MMDGVEQKDPGGVAERKRVPGRSSPVVQSNGSDAIGTAIRAKSRIPGVGLDEIARKCAEPEFSRFREGDRRPRKPPRKRGWTPEERKRNAKNLGHRRPVCRVVFPSLNPCPIARQRLPSRRLGTRARPCLRSTKMHLANSLPRRGFPHQLAIHQQSPNSRESIWHFSASSYRTHMCLFHTSCLQPA